MGWVNDGLETHRWNGTKSAFADCSLGLHRVRYFPAAVIQQVWSSPCCTSPRSGPTTDSMKPKSRPTPAGAVRGGGLRAVPAPGFQPGDLQPGDAASVLVRVDLVRAGHHHHQRLEHVLDLDGVALRLQHL